MEFFNKIGKVLVKKMDLTIILIASIILFLYFTDGDLIAGALTAFFALVIYVSVNLLYQEYKNMQNTKPEAAKTTVKKATVKKSAKKSK